MFAYIWNDGVLPEIPERRIDIADFTKTPIKNEKISFFQNHCHFFIFIAFNQNSLLFIAMKMVFEIHCYSLLATNPVLNQSMQTPISFYSEQNGLSFEL